MSFRKYANRNAMVSDNELWETHPLLVSYNDYYDATTGEHVSRIATFHKRVEEWDDVHYKWVMVDLYNSTVEPPKPTPLNETPGNR